MEKWVFSRNTLTLNISKEIGNRKVSEKQGDQSERIFTYV
jgi:hypothetical protein